MHEPRPTRRAFTAWLGGTLLAGCALRAPVASVQNERARSDAIDRSIAKARDFLIARQSPDDAWRSTVYGFFKDGSALTAHVAIALCETGNNPTLQAATNRAADFLIGLFSSGADLDYPVYTAADASRVLGQIEPSTRASLARSRWLSMLRKSQLDESLGWKPSDLDYGGWGFAPTPPRKSAAGGFHGPWDWSNLSSTVYALEAIRSADGSSAESVYRRAVAFIHRCQNFDELNAGNPNHEHDGGFFFAASQAIRNKAGGWTDVQGAARFNSYGSMTCDGIRALIALGTSLQDSRLIAAQRWLQTNFDVEHNPGHFVPANEDLRDATYFYYLHSLAEVCRALPPMNRHCRDIADALIARQQPDGSWTNRFTDGREDDPLVATPLALRALRSFVMLNKPD